MTHALAHMYAAIKAKWSKPECGPWPSVANFENAEKVFSPGNNNAVSAAFQMREAGMLSTEYAHLGLKPAFNDVRTATAAGYFKSPAKPIAARVNSVGCKLKVHKVFFVKAKVKASKVTGKAKGKAKAKVTKRTKRTVKPAATVTAKAA